MTLHGGLLKSWSSTQSTIAKSSGEAEYYALARAAAEGLALKALMQDLGWDVKVRVWVDASVAKSIASRTGLGKVRHMEVVYLWVQEAVKLRKIEVRKIRGDTNPSDVLTKPKSFQEQQPKLAFVGVSVRRGKS